jgi:Flp pilus assembly protein TadD
MLNGADTCRRCRAELQTVQFVAREARALVNAAIHHLLLNDPQTATRLLQRALVCHATPDIRHLLRWVSASTADVVLDEAETIEGAFLD